MKSRRKSALNLMTVVVLLILVFDILPVHAAGNVSTLSWNLVDSTKHLDYDSDTKYLKYVAWSQSLWNAYKSGVIRVSGDPQYTDVTISDYYEVSSTAGYTSSDGIIQFNDYQMSTYGTEQKRFVCAHELGHALGLAHNLSGSIMYAYVSTTNTLSIHDKASYDYCYTYNY